uniref:ATP synthase subunit a n=1 Tax=Eremobates cf. palpisetulosus SEM-2008 TaxID=507470 RepID=B2CKF0_9ARAC|nr:ATP synthase F0 subunit 6 [Eremobates cf. palpisetulosus SEM-2008]ACA49838.1 ATP synthase subunit 6 [Eremobates cf. palpisetulosus SEM-2008]
MMTNLFSIFDPSTSTMSFNWISMVIPMMLLPPIMWMIPSQSTKILQSITMTLNNEFKTLFTSKILNSMTFIMISLMTFIAINNSFGLLPYVFTATSHIMVTLMMAFPFWLTLMLFGWINDAKLMMAHLVPQGTPGPLMAFMVCIETVSNLIRPITLSVRLAANMIAGHLLISLLGDYTMNTTVNSLPILLLTQIMLLLLESAVAFIQSYVFVVLAGLYATEIHH